jgi:hypothetical protein
MTTPNEACSPRYQTSCRLIQARGAGIVHNRMIGAGAGGRGTDTTHSAARVPCTYQGLLALPGIGDKMAQLLQIVNHPKLYANYPLTVADAEDKTAAAGVCAAAAAAAAAGAVGFAEAPQDPDPDPGNGSARVTLEGQGDIACGGEGHDETTKRHNAPVVGGDGDGDEWSDHQPEQC